MARIAYRPVTVNDYGPVTTTGSGSVLGDNNDNTGKYYENDAGSIAVYPNFNESLIPVGKDVIAVRCAHRQVNGGWLNLYNGWISSYLRINGARVPASRAYKQDGNSGTPRTIMGPPIYKSAIGAWDTADLNLMSTDHGTAQGTIGPNTKNRWCGITEGLIYVVTHENVPVPTVPSPANAATVASSSVNFSAQIPAVQEEQPVQAVFQVARDAGFTQDVRTYVGALNSSEVGTSRSNYTSVKGKASFTDLGPGSWALRMKGRDYAGRESAWGTTTFFNVVHPALVAPTLVAPVGGSTISDPYSVRTGQIPAEPTGDRKAGIEWQFSPNSGFTGTPVSWKNKLDARFTAGNVSYASQPNEETLPGLYGPTVSLEDPDQRLAQGAWFARVREVDPWDQVGPWSANYTFTVAHKPIVANPKPALGVAFDPNETPVQWDFTDPWNGDFQTAYQMKVYDLSNNLLQDTGKILSTISKAQMNVGSGHLQEDLKYTIEIWDRDDVKSTSLVANTFFKSVSPITTLAFPAEGEQIVTGQPQFDWDSTFSRVGVSQKAFRVKVVQAENLVTVYDTGTVVSAASIHLPPAPILKNEVSYQLQLTVTDTDDLSKTLYRNFSTNFIRPSGTQAFVEAENYNEDGFVNVIWACDVDPFFAEYRIYRRLYSDDNSNEWVLAGTVQDANVLFFHDWLVAGAGNYEYGVNQVAYRYGSLVESEFEAFPIMVNIQSDAYWLIIPDDESMNMKLRGVTGDKFTMKKQSNSFVIIGGGMRMINGPRIGKEGSLSVQVRASLKSGRKVMDVLDELDLNKPWMLLRDPFGGITQIGLGEWSYDRMAGVGVADYGDMEIPYYEVKGKVSGQA